MSLDQPSWGGDAEREAKVLTTLPNGRGRWTPNHMRANASCGLLPVVSGVCHNGCPRAISTHPRGHVSDTVERTSSSQTSPAGQRPAAAASGSEPRQALAPLLAVIEERAPAERRETIAAFARSYLRRLGDDEISAAPAETLYGLVRSTFDFVDGRRLQPWVVRVFDPDAATDGFTSPGHDSRDERRRLAVPRRLRDRGAHRTEPRGTADPAPGHRHVEG